MDKSTTDLPVVEEGLMDGNANLIGAKCPECNQYTFPFQPFCPRCSNEMEECTLSQEGELYTYTIIRQGPPWWKDKVPYTIGYVKLPEEIIIKSHVKNDKQNELKIGSKMLIEPHVILNEQGEKVKIYRFCPIS
ncbi:Zn-ribbon domain-containing OB-fold protein [Salicibibacter kimchii]|uniref:DNA-binding protein n=1 Tax=Salicibibacter kimchii TaxID=2099786 RepID=A0A345BW43_9BACI|nr:OB-fold domain-containing protein [Salicibibacter kimchii]AXF55174.1 hypothetical protein DT065_03505 [Salicibibacter kimchii]